MKSVKGEILSTTPIPVSKATKILSEFYSADTGASQAICAYLRRASVSFNELNQLHKELKSNKKRHIQNSETVTKFDGEEGGRNKNKKKKVSVVSDNNEKNELGFAVDKVRLKVEESDFGVESEEKKKRGEVENLEANGKVRIKEDGNVGTEDRGRKKHKKTKGENGCNMESFEEDNNRIKIVGGINLVMKKHKRRRETSEHQVNNVKENGGSIEVK